MFGSCWTPPRRRCRRRPRSSSDSARTKRSELRHGMNEMSVVPSAPTFWTIMSTLTASSASARKTRAAIPGLSGTDMIVNLRLRGVVRDARDDRLLHQLPPAGGSRRPPRPVNEERTWIPDAVVAGELDRAEHQYPGPAGRELEHLLVTDLGEFAGPRPTMRGSAVKDPVDVGVDLAQRPASSEAASATAVASEPPRPRVVTSNAVETPWKPATRTIEPESSASWIRRARTSRILAPDRAGCRSRSPPASR